MTAPFEFGEPGPETPLPNSRLRRAGRVVILVTLILSMVFLAFISGRGVVTITPDIPSTPTALPAATRPSRLAVVATDGNLVTMDATGGSVASYARPGVAFTFPAWSPDGSRIAVIGQSGEDTGVYVFTTLAGGAGTADPTVVYRDPDRPPFYLSWGPDGRDLTFLTTEPNGLALRIASADGSSPVAAIREGSPMYWAWASPTRLFVHSGGEGVGAFLGEVGPDGTSVEPTAIESGGFRAPAVSGDGTYRAYVTPGDGAPEQVVVETRDRTNRHTAGVFGAAALDFGPGGDRLAFVAPAEAGREQSLPVGPLRIMDASSGAVRTLLADSIVAFFWSPDGGTIAALQIIAPGGNEVATAGNVVLAAAVRPRPTRADADASTPGLALRLAFVDVVSGAIRSHRAVRVSDLFTTQLLPYFDQYALSHRMWSSDGSSVVLPTVTEDGTNQLSIIRADGSGTRTVADALTGFWSP